MGERSSRDIIGICLGRITRWHGITARAAGVFGAPIRARFQQPIRRTPPRGTDTRMRTPIQSTIATNGDPLNFIDPGGQFRCNPEVCDQPIIGPTPPQPGPHPPPGPVRDPNTNFPGCNDNGNPTTETTLNFISNNYGDALIASSAYQVPVAWILGWSAIETTYGTNSPSKFNENFFSEEKKVTDPIGQWNFAVPCPDGAYTGSAKDNPDFNYVCYGSFLGSAASALTSRYGRLIQSMLATDPSVSIVDVFNAVYAAGWDKSKATTAGNTIAGTQNRINSEITCLKKKWIHQLRSAVLSSALV